MAYRACGTVGSGMNNYKIVCTDKRKDVKKEYEYCFETIEDAMRAKRAIENGGNKAEIKRVK